MSNQLEIVMTAGVVVFSDNLSEVVLVRHKKAAAHETGVYGLPAGRIEVGESNEQAAVRELQEETDLVVKTESLVQTGQYTADIDRPDGRKWFQLNTFACVVEKGTLSESDETSPEWVTVTEVGDYNLLPNIKQAIFDAIEVLKAN